MSDIKSGNPISSSHTVVSQSFGTGRPLAKSQPFVGISDSNSVDDQKPVVGIQASAHSVQIVRQLIEFIKTL
jgi:hypothetical protein